jgi:hypothetical protein
LLWLLASESKDGSFNGDPEELAFRLRLEVSEVVAGLTPLIDKGFFSIASGVLAECLQPAIPEREREGETEGELELSNDNSSPAVAGPVEVIAEVYHDLMTACESIRVWTPKRTKKINAADKLAAKVCKQLGWDYSRRREQFWRAYFEQCQLDPWLRGDVANPNNPKWKQNLFVLIDEERFGKIMDAALAALA